MNRDCTTGYCNVSTCAAASCGDGVVETGEDCDDSGESATCNADCTAVMCGDSIVNHTAGEVCDDGVNAGGEGQCVAGCHAVQMCGDNVVEGTEACDDGVNAGGEGACAAGCAAIQHCGDTVVEGTETCDDGGTSPGDGCDASCQVETYAVCQGTPPVCHPVRILWAVGDVDNPQARADIAAITGGPVDYFAVTGGTPDLATLQSSYDCVFTHPDSSYLDPATFASVLVSYIDGGGDVVLGIATGYAPPTGFAGTALLGASYCPVVTNGSVTSAAATYAGDGTNVLHSNVTAYGIGLYDTTVTLQGTGVADSHFTNGVIASAYRGDRKVVYLNGTNSPPFSPTGDWARLIANACAAGYHAP